MASRGKLILGGLATYLGAVYIGMSYAGTNQENNCCQHAKFNPNDIKLTDEQRFKSFSEKAKIYDQEVGKDEILTGISLLRWWYIRQAKGNVLEVGCGTGRNFDYYSVVAKKVVAVDAVPEMVKESKKKLKIREEDSETADKRFSVLEMDGHDLKFEDNSFDTVVDTFGLCSYNDPIKVLHEMKRVCKKDGKIILIEHGKGTYDFINNAINSRALIHANNWGCIFNKDILELVKQAGLKISNVNRFHFGTTYIIEVTNQ